MSNCAASGHKGLSLSLAVPIVSADVGQHMSLRDWMKGMTKGEKDENSRLDLSLRYCFPLESF